MGLFATIWLTLTGRADPPRPPINTALGPLLLPSADDAPEPERAGEPSYDNARGIALLIDYVNAKGEASRRRIVIYGVTGCADGDVLIRAWCCERDDYRSFRVSRITRLVDNATGEVFEPPRRFFEEEIAGGWPRQPTATPQGADVSDGMISVVVTVPERAVPREPSRHDRLRALESEILALIFVARADGRMRAAERGAIVDHVLARDPALATERAYVERYVGRLYPDASIASALAPDLDRLDATVAAQLAAALERVLDADGDRDETEMAIVGPFMAALRRDQAVR